MIAAAAPPAERPATSDSCWVGRELLDDLHGDASDERWLAALALLWIRVDLGLCVEDEPHLTRLIDDIGFRDVTSSGAWVRTLGRAVLFDGENAAWPEHGEMIGDAVVRFIGQLACERDCPRMRRLERFWPPSGLFRPRSRLMKG